MEGASRNMLEVPEFDNKLIIDVNVVILWSLQLSTHLPVLHFLGNYQSFAPTEG
jgi:hypothetical protein